jgi:hypothetical protein
VGKSLKSAWAGVIVNQFSGRRCWLWGVVAGVASAGAASPNVLPEGTEKEPLTGISKSGKSTFSPGALKVESTKSEGTFSGNAPKSGTFDLLYLEYKLELANCIGLEDTKEGSVLVKGTFDVRHCNLEGKLFTAELFLLKEATSRAGNGYSVSGGASRVNSPRTKEKQSKN